MVLFLLMASIIPDRVEATTGVSLTVYVLTTLVTNYLAPVVIRGSFNWPDRRWPVFFCWFHREFGM